MGVVVPSMSRRMPPTGSINERASHADGLEVCVDAAVGIPGCPAGGILEQPDAPNLLIGAQIEPVQRPPRYADQIPRLNFNADDRRSLGIHMEDPAALHDETDLVLVMPAFTAELREHGVQAGRL